MFDCCFFFFKQKTAYEMRISDWSSDVCSSDLGPVTLAAPPASEKKRFISAPTSARAVPATARFAVAASPAHAQVERSMRRHRPLRRSFPINSHSPPWCRSEQHTSELQSLMRISYAVFCLKKKNKNTDKK